MPGTIQNPAMGSEEQTLSREGSQAGRLRQEELKLQNVAPPILRGKGPGET